MNNEHIRTLAIVRQLIQGKTLTLDGYKLAMGEDMSIGFTITNSDGTEHVAGLSTIDLAELNRLLNKFEIGMPIPCTKIST